MLREMQTCYRASTAIQSICPASANLQHQAQNRLVEVYNQVLVSILSDAIQRALYSQFLYYDRNRKSTETAITRIWPSYSNSRLLPHPKKFLQHIHNTSELLPGCFLCHSGTQFLLFAQHITALKVLSRGQHPLDIGVGSCFFKGTINSQTVVSAAHN